jgi:hypothetical protein
MCQVHQPSGSVAAAVDRCEGDLHRSGLDPHRTTSYMPSREVGALLDTAAEVPIGIILSDDETDTFRPFVSDKTQAVLHLRLFCHKSRLREMKTFNAIAEPSVSNMLTYLATPSLPSLLSSHLLRSRLT